MACWLWGFSGWWFAGPQSSGYMSYTELLLVLVMVMVMVMVVCPETSRRGAEPAHPVVGRTNEIKSSRSRIAREQRPCADPPRSGSSVIGQVIDRGDRTEAQRRTPRRVGPVCQDPPRRTISTNTLRMM